MTINPNPLQPAATVGVERSPRLAPERLQSFVRHYFDRRDRYLQVLKKHPGAGLPHFGQISITL